MLESAAVENLWQKSNLTPYPILRMCGCQSGPSSALPVITTFTSMAWQALRVTNVSED